MMQPVFLFGRVSLTAPARARRPMSLRPFFEQKRASCFQRAPVKTLDFRPPPSIFPADTSHHVFAMVIQLVGGRPRILLSLTIAQLSGDRHRFVGFYFPCHEAIYVVVLSADCAVPSLVLSVVVVVRVVGSSVFGSDDVVDVLVVLEEVRFAQKLPVGISRLQGGVRIQEQDLQRI